MGGIVGLLYQPWWLLLYAIAIIHFVRRRPAGFWLWVILFLPSIGVVVYIVVEVIPDVGLLRQAFAVFPRRKRIRGLEAMIVVNPSAGNLEELGDLYIDDNMTSATASVWTPLLSIGYGHIATLTDDTLTVDNGVALMPLIAGLSHRIREKIRYIPGEPTQTLPWRSGGQRQEEELHVIP